MIKMHTYGDGRTGLAAFCDTCGRQITDNGYVVWNEDDTGVTEWRVIHQRICDDNRFDMSMPLNVEVVYLANSTGVDLSEAIRLVGTFASIG